MRSAIPAEEWPISLLTINLNPATLLKAGGHYDAVIVAAVLAAQRVFGAEELRSRSTAGRAGAGWSSPGRYAGFWPPHWRLSKQASQG